VGALDGIPGIKCYAELFHPRGVFRKFGATSRPRTLGERIERKIRTLFPVPYLNITTFITGLRYKAVGFKLFPDHNRTMLDHIMADDSWSIIFLWRENLLALYSSHLIAESTGAWVSVDKAAINRQTVHFDRADFVKYRDRIMNVRTGILERLEKRSYFSLEYEDIRDRFVEIFDYVGLPPQPSALESSPTVRQNSAKVLERFDNPEEVLECLTEMGLRHWCGEMEAVSHSPEESAEIEHSPHPTMLPSAVGGDTLPGDIRR